jgi:hypothetical protein
MIYRYVACFVVTAIIPFLSLISSDSTKSRGKERKIAYCLTGQLARLELLSKIANIFIHNGQIGHTVHVFILLDNDVEEVKQTFWRYDYSDAPYVNFGPEKLLAFINKKLSNAGVSKKVTVHVRLENPSQDNFQVVGDMIPVTDKVISHQMSGEGENKEGVEPAAVRFQNNMRYLLLQNRYRRVIIVVTTPLYHLSQVVGWFA